MHRFSGLYAVTDSHLQPDDTVLIESVQQALAGGVKVVQYRDKSNDAGKRLRQAGALKVLCHQHQALLLINDDVELCVDVEADGVHLGQSDMALSKARERLGSYAIIGISCGDSLELALQAQKNGADYVAFGAFYPTNTKPDAKSATLPLLEEAREQITVPIVAIGGITVERAVPLIERGANMVAVVSDLFTAVDIEDRAKHYLELFS